MRENSIPDFFFFSLHGNVDVKDSNTATEF